MMIVDDDCCADETLARDLEHRRHLALRQRELEWHQSFNETRDGTHLPLKKLPYRAVRSIAVSVTELEPRFRGSSHSIQSSSVGGAGRQG